MLLQHLTGYKPSYLTRYRSSKPIGETCVIFKNFRPN